MSALIGAIVLLAAMLYALWVLFSGMRDGTYNYFGRNIARADQPVIFWFVMAVMIVCLYLGAKSMPYFLVVLL